MNDSIEMNYYTPDTDTWAVSLDGRYISAVQNYLETDGIPTEGVTEIVTNAAKTLSYCPAPEGAGICQKTGLVIGKVQSGKTSNFISKFQFQDLLFSPQNKHVQKSTFTIF